MVGERCTPHCLGSGAAHKTRMLSHGHRRASVRNMRRCISIHLHTCTNIYELVSMDINDLCDWLQIDASFKDKWRKMQIAEILRRPVLISSFSCGWIADWLFFTELCHQVPFWEVRVSKVLSGNPNNFTKVLWTCFIDPNPAQINWAHWFHVPTDNLRLYHNPFWRSWCSL